MVISNQRVYFVKMNISPLQLLIFTLATTGITGAIALVLKLNASFYKAKLYFVAFILIQSVNILYAFAILTELYASYPAIIQTNHLLQLATPVVIYLFSFYLINPKKKSPQWLYILILPAAILLYYLVPIYLQPNPVKVNLLEEMIVGQMPLDQKILFAIKTINGIVFITLALLELRKHEKNVFNFYGTIEDKKHHWLRNALLSFFLIWASAIFLRSQFDFNIATTALAIMVGLINWYLLFNFSVFVQPLKFAQEEKEEELEQISKEINTSQIGLEELESYKEKFLANASNQTCYLEVGCNLTQFSTVVGFKTHIVSGILNKILETNFYDFISKQRAEHAANMLVDKKNNYLTVDAIAQECGFKSKATFYKAFKKTYQTTPSQYQKEHNIG